MLAKEAGPFLKINFAWVSPELQEAFNKVHRDSASTKDTISHEHKWQVNITKRMTRLEDPLYLELVQTLCHLNKIGKMVGHPRLTLPITMINGQEENQWTGGDDLAGLGGGFGCGRPLQDKFYQSPLISAGAIPSFYIKPEDCRELRPESVHQKYAQIPSTNEFFKVEVKVEPVDNPVDDDHNKDNTTDGGSDSGQGDAMLIDEELGKGEEELASNAAGGRGSNQGVVDTVTVAESGQDETTIWDPEALFDKLDKVFNGNADIASPRVTDVKSLISCVVG
ncbi:hypothetical protein JCM5296_006570 [Sporobolomyces johnsonii]